MNNHRKKTLDDFITSQSTNKSESPVDDRIHKAGKDVEGINTVLEHFVEARGMICEHCGSEDIIIDPYFWSRGLKVYRCNRCGRFLPPVLRGDRRKVSPLQITLEWLESEQSFSAFARTHNISHTAVCLNVELVSFYALEPIELMKKLDAKPSNFIGLDLTQLSVKGSQKDYLHLNDALFENVIYSHKLFANPATKMDIKISLRLLKESGILDLDKVQLFYADHEPRVHNALVEEVGRDRVVLDEFHVIKRCREFIFKGAVGGQVRQSKIFLNKLGTVLLERRKEVLVRKLDEEIYPLVDKYKSHKGIIKAINYVRENEEFILNRFRVPYAPATNESSERTFELLNNLERRARGFKRFDTTVKLLDLVIDHSMFTPFKASRRGLKGIYPIQQVAKIDLNIPAYKYYIRPDYFEFNDRRQHHRF